MIITKLRGGLGNQMFQYAIGKKLASEAGVELRLDMSWFSSPGAVNPKREYDLSIFNIDVKPSTSLDKYLVKIFGRSIVEGSSDPSAGIKNAYLDGFWQSERYFKEISGEIRKDFTFKSELSATAKTLAEDIRQSASVCLNVRRGDFISDGKFVGVDYYKKAVAEISRSVPGERFFVFSDDIPWCKSNLGFIEHAVFVDHSYAGERFSDYLHLMSLCRHFIIPNSTFAWWAAWLGQAQDKKVIAPKIWYPDHETDAGTLGIVAKDWLLI